ncbi:alkaline phosphatase [Pseudothauera lacus]|uniref:Alkaline phosphatase n=1 Tax=Pseudothauera lacus TaxID=2136175 RepID=A0A2T4IJB3_9RHOO|nr:alkaline phosphatase [Pseudothauera lacus]PTD97867.1 alkaline phosphatase [Pseudothauera lacus]
MIKMKFLACALAAAGATMLLPPSAVAANDSIAKNVILFISDGASWGTWDMASYYQYGELGMQSYDQFDVKLGMTTMPMNTSSRPTYNDTQMISYDPARAWDTTPVAGSYGGWQSYFAGYDYIKRDYTDSAAAGTALATGEKTFNNAIDYNNFGEALPYITQTAKAAGMSTGVVSSVPFSHATPATFGAQNINRNNYGAISYDMIYNQDLDLIMGGGNPLYDSNGNLRSSPNYTYVSSTAWNVLNSSDSPRTLITSKEDFEALAAGTLQVDGPLIGVPEVYDTLQYSRNAGVMGADASTPSGVATIDSVPTLVDMTMGAINYLSQGDNGFFMMVEGGAVDWAAHATNTARIIEEQIDFNLSVDAAVNWVNTYSNWDETLIIVLTDHGNAMPMGPDSDTIAFQPIQNNGQGVLPGVKWHYATHTNENTLFFAHGAGADLFYDHVVGVDDGLRDILAFNDGRYIDNTAPFQVMQAVMAPVPEPEAYAMMLAGLGLVGAFARRRRQG